MWQNVSPTTTTTTTTTAHQSMFHTVKSTTNENGFIICSTLWQGPCCVRVRWYKFTYESEATNGPNSICFFFGALEILKWNNNQLQNDNILFGIFERKARTSGRMCGCAKIMNFSASTKWKTEPNKVIFFLQIYDVLSYVCHPCVQCNMCD